MINYKALDGVTVAATQIYDIFVAGNPDGSYTVTGVSGTEATLHPNVTSVTFEVGNNARQTIDWVDSTGASAAFNAFGGTPAAPAAPTTFVIGTSPVAGFGLTFWVETGANPSPPKIGEVFGPNGISLPCFAAGTRIRTARGPVAVEDLLAGDEAVTEAGIVRPVRWIGRRRVNLARHPEPETVRPIRVLAGAIAEGVPCRDVLLSPDHAVALDGVLVPARLLVNGTSIIQETGRNSVVYFHVELDRHDILLAEDMPVESYLDTGNRAAFEHEGAALALHPDFPATVGRTTREQDSCAPFATDAARVRPIWERLAARSAAMDRSVARAA